MGRQSNIGIKESEEELLILIRKQVKQKNKDRLRSLLYIKTNKYKTRQELSKALGYHIRTMERWLSRYKTSGLEAMLIPDVLERESFIVTAEIHQGLSERLHEPTHGFSSYVEAQRWVYKEYGVEITYHWLRAYMIKKFNSKIKQPRKSHIKKEDKAIEAFLKTT